MKCLGCSPFSQASATQRSSFSFSWDWRFSRTMKRHWGMGPTKCSWFTHRQCPGLPNKSWGKWGRGYLGNIGYTHGASWDAMRPLVSCPVPRWYLFWLPISSQVSMVKSPYFQRACGFCSWIHDFAGVSLSLVKLSEKIPTPPSCKMA